MINRNSVIGVLPLAMALLSAGCGDGKDDTAQVSETGATGQPAQETGDGQSEESGAPPDTAPPGDSGNPVFQLPEYPDIYLVPNVDDDNDDWTADWDARSLDSENDLAAFAVEASLFSSLEEGEHLELLLEGDISDLRVWNGGSVILGDSLSGTIESVELSAGDSDQLFQVESAYFLVEGSITLLKVDSEGDVLDSTSFGLLTAPLILNHHLQDTEQAFVVELGSSNQDFTDSFLDGLGKDHYYGVNGNFYGWDVWIQDEFEFATVTNGEQRIDVVIDSIRDRGLDPFPEIELEGPDVAVMTWGSGPSNSLDSFGNLDASPPVTVDGVYYPFGRIYYGGSDDYHPVQELLDFLADQKVQDPFRLDTTWLCVGHVDEFVAFVPDPEAPQGFRMLLADVPSAYEILESMDRSTSLPKYRTGHGYDTVGEILADSSLRALNEDLQSEHLDPLTEQLKEELNISDDEIILVPSIFEEVSYCGPFVAAMIPGMVNLAVETIEGSTHLFIADPFMRSDVSDQSSDPLIAYMGSTMPSSLELHFIDDWNVYHMGLGEVHCGSNTLRTPLGEWWSSALDLLED